MLETKDYLTLGASAVAIGISLGALAVAFLSYRLAARRDQRDLDARKPLLEIEAPTCDGLGSWLFRFVITNRDEAPIEVVRLMSDERRVVDLHHGAPFAVSLANLTDPESLNFATIQRRVPIGDKLEFTCEADAYRGKRVGSQAETMFTLEYRRTVGDPSLQRLSSRLIVNP